MAISKVVYAGRTLVDLTADTVSQSTLALGATAHGADGENISGTAPIYGGVSLLTDQGSAALSYVTAAESAYTDSDYASSSVVRSYASTSAHNDALKPLELASPVTGTGGVMCVERPGLSWAAAATAGNSVPLCNFVPGTTEHVLMAASYGTMVGALTLRVTDPGFRIVGDSSGDYNARDLGGFACDGGTVKYGILYRGSDVGGKASFRAIGTDVLHIQDEVDVQGAESTATKSCFDGSAYHHFSLDTPSSYEELYKLDGTSYPTVKECLEHVMQNACAGVVTYVHCSLGADRTGAICFWLQGILGVSGKHLDISYELTALAGKMWGTADVTTRRRTYAPWVGLRKYFASLGSTTTVRDACLYWAYKVGIDIDLVNAYRAAMSTGTPETLSYKRWDVSYTNQIPISTDTDGSVYNKVGYKTGYKLSSSGGLESWSGVEVTGFIPVSVGDVIRLSGITNPSNSANAGSVNRFAFYKSDKSFITVINSKTNSIGWWDCTYDDDNNPIKFTVKSDKAPAVAYMRVSAEEINSESVITVNEEIK